jgi:hypothetical protein
VAELIERLLAALIVIMLLGIVLFLVTRGNIVATTDKTPPAPPLPGEVVYVKKSDRLPEARPSEYKRDWSRSPTLVVPRDPERVRVVREKHVVHDVQEKPHRPRYKEREVRKDYWQSEDYYERRHYERPVYERRYSEPVYERRYSEPRTVEYTDSTVYQGSYHYQDDCSGADCACSCGRPPYWSGYRWSCPD